MVMPLMRAKVVEFVVVSVVATARLLSSTPAGPVAPVGPSGPEVNGGWFFKSFRVADFVPLSTAFRIRFTASDLGSASVIEAGVDGVRLNNTADGLVCTDLCPADITGDGNVDVLDLIDLLLCFGLPAVPGCEAQDITGDGAVNALDLIDLLSAFGTACP